MIVVANYCIDSTEVTSAQYAAFVSAKGGDTSGQDPWCAWNTSYAPSFSPGGDVPVSVDWCDAFAFCKWAGKRLCGNISGGSNPTSGSASASSSQWYNACSAGGTQTYPYSGPYDHYKCNGSGYGAAKALPVKQAASCQGGYPGIYDMSGNVFEWEDSCFSYVGAQDSCYLRGGAFTSDFMLLACGSGVAAPRSSAGGAVGFRCCS